MVFRSSSAPVTLLLSRFMALMVCLIIPLSHITALADPDFTPRYLLLTSTALSMIIVLAFARESVRAQVIRGMNTRVFLVGLLFLIWLSVEALRTRDAGAGLLEVSRWTLSVLTVALGRFVFSEDRFLRYEWPKWVFLSWTIISISLFVQVMESWATGSFGFATYTWGGLAGNKNFLSEWLLFQSFFLLNGWHHPERRWRIALRVAFIVTLLQLVFLKTWAVWIAGGIAIVVGLWIQKPIWRKALFTFILFVMVGVGLLGLRGMDHWIKPIDITRTDQSQAGSSYERLLMWRNSIRMIADHPVLGVGTSAWKVEQANYGVGGTTFLNNGFVSFEHPHQEYLAVWAETGLIGLLLLLTFYFLVFRGSTFQAHGDNIRRNSRLALIAFGITALFAYPMSRDLPWMVVLMHLSVLLAIPNRPTSVRKDVETARWPWLLMIGVLVVILVAFVWRFSGEYHLGQSSAARWQRIHGRSYREAVRADNFFFHTDRTGTPVAWYAGDAAFRLGDRTTALAWLNQAHGWNPYHLKTLNDLGTVLEQESRKQEAESMYREALRISPSFVEARLNLTALYYNVSSLDSAYILLKGVPQPLRPRSRDEYQYSLFRKALIRKAFITTEGFEAVTDSVEVDRLGNACYEGSPTLQAFRRCLGAVSAGVLR